MSLKENINRARIEAMLEAFSQGIENQDSLLDLVDEAEKEFTDRRGNNSEARFVEIAENISGVSVTKTGATEDYYHDIDFFLRYKSNPDNKDEIWIPVQIKSSLGGVKKAKRELSPDVLVLSCGPKAASYKIKYLIIQKIKLRLALRKNLNKVP